MLIIKCRLLAEQLIFLPEVMRLLAVLRRPFGPKIRDKLDFYSQFHPSSLSMQQFLDFGRICGFFIVAQEPVAINKIIVALLSCTNDCRLLVAVILRADDVKFSRPLAPSQRGLLKHLQKISRCAVVIFTICIQARGGTCAKSYLFLKKELLVRLANIMQEIALLPQPLLHTPSCKIVRHWYETSFIELLVYEDKAEEDKICQKFTEDLKVILKRHKQVVETMAELFCSVVLCRKAPNLSVAYTRHATYKKSLMVHAYDSSRFLCERYYMKAPSLEIECKNASKSSHGVSTKEKITMVYVPSHLYHMLFEMIKNAMRAVVEYNDEQECLPPIKATIVCGKEDLSIKISDRGGGVPRSITDQLFNYMYTTAPPVHDHGDQAPLAGYGYGLPLSRLYARYFLGDLFLVSMEGLGTDACIYLKALPIDASELLPVFTTSSKRIYKSSQKASDWSQRPCPSSSTSAVAFQSRTVFANNNNRQSVGPF
uniref:Protein-serine/threonine kinase n=1 Tax=Romanomermis culicivorax TaxID=13658 RepID=A0A915KU18_ROMCU